jgi:uncharacterized protein (DUF1501 family)
MLTRRDFLMRTLQGSSLLAVGSVVPEFLANTALAAEAGKDTVLVVVELSGGNDGLNTVIPYADDLYHKARPTLRFKKEQVVRVDDHIGLNPAMGALRPVLDKGHLAIVQGVGYPNPDRSHFESMDIWQSADPRRRIGTGWIGRSVPELQDKKGNVPVMQLGPKNLPLALQGAPAGVVSLNNIQSFRLQLDAPDPNKRFARKRLIEDLAKAGEQADKNSLLSFVQRREVQTYATLERLQQVLQETGAGDRRTGEFFFNPNEEGFKRGQLVQKLQLIARLIQKDFGTRVFYVALDGFDTHAGQAEEHRRLLEELANSITTFFNDLRNGDHDKRVLLMTFSEFGRRVQENSSRGTDHGAASCMFVAGPAVKGGAVGKHPSLNDLDSGDLRFHTDFRRVYATLLDKWLGCDSKVVLGDKFDHVDLLKPKA